MSKTDKREHILSAAMELLATQGFHGAPMAQIAGHAGVGAGTIYRYFESRDTLILAVYQMIYENFIAFILEAYPSGRPIRECFFHMGRKIVDFYLLNPLQFRYTEQFHHSPYGLETRKKKLLNSSGEYDFCHELYDRGIALQVIKPMPLALFFNLAFAPIVWAIRDHLSGFVTLDEDLIQLVVSCCWDSIKM